MKTLRSQMRKEKNENLASTYQQLTLTEEQLKECRKSEKELKSQLSHSQKVSFIRKILNVLYNFNI